MDDLAKLAVEGGREGTNRIIDAIGPETFTYRELVRTIGRIIGVNRPIISVPPTLGYWASWLIGKLMRDVFVTRDEIIGLMQDLLYTNSPPVGTTRLTAWAGENAASLGRHYASELKRRLDRSAAYEDL